MVNILVVEDEKPVRKFLAEILTMYGHHVVLAEDGSRGYEIAKSVPIDIVITDLVMPNMSGVDLIAKLKKIRPGLPIIAMTGGGGIAGTFDYAPAAEKLLGAEAVLTKPFDLQTVVDKIKCHT